MVRRGASSPTRGDLRLLPPQHFSITSKSCGACSSLLPGSMSSPLPSALQIAATDPATTELVAPSTPPQDNDAPDLHIPEHGFPAHGLFPD